MLVLSRREGTFLVVGEGAHQVTFIVHRINGNRVTVGIAAAKDVRIVRGELLPEDHPVVIAERKRHAPPSEI